MIDRNVDDVEVVKELRLHNIEIVASRNPEKVELYLVDDQGERLEGGTFDRDEFMTWIYQFYQRKF